jgi:hypothetical protein
VGARLDEDATPDPIDTGRFVLRLSWDGEVVWRRDVNAHHDIVPLPDGRFLTLVMERRRIPAIDLDHDIADDVLTWLSPQGRPVERLSVYDVLAGADPPYPIQRAGEKDTPRPRSSISCTPTPRGAPPFRRSPPAARSTDRTPSCSRPDIRTRS